MNDGLLDGFRHHAWATLEMLPFCRGLTDEQLRAAAEGSYWCRLTGETLGWDWRSDETPGMSTLADRAADVAGRWETFCSATFDAEQLVVTRRADGSTLEVRAGVVVAQALHHGSEHRGQICTMLTMIGVDPPALDVWSYGLAHGGAHRRDGAP